MKDPKKYIFAAKLVADLLGDPDIEREVKEKLARRKRINALVAERAKANLTMQEVAERMGITYRMLYGIEEFWEDKDLKDYPKVARAYVKAICQSRKKGGAECRTKKNSAGCCAASRG